MHFKYSFMYKIFCYLILLSTATFAQQTSIYNDDPTQRLPVGTEKPNYGIITATGENFQTARVEPPHWWTDMTDRELEILLYDKNIGQKKVKIDYPGVRLKKVTRVENPNYLFVKIDVGRGAKAGKFQIELSDKNGSKNYPYELKNRSTDPQRNQGLASSDFIYLIMPDRFANGNYDNDSYADMNQVGINRDKMFFRHGGDLRGIIEKLDYIESLGVTALWLNPVLENDEKFESYHGYAITDFYNIDKRFGSNEEYKMLVEECHARGIKVIMDIIHNHVGDQHWLIKDLPAEDWLHQYEEFTRTTYRAPTLMDPYASEHDKNLMTDGWFDHHMPDLNQQNPQLARYLTQSNIWWMEESGQDAYRVDTYAYPDQEFMSDWGKKMRAEYGENVFYGETWVHGPAVQAQFTEDNNIRKDYNSNMPAVTDFQLYYAINEALTKPQGWTEGAARIYYTLAQDFLYEDPYRNVTFLDNHDLSRFYSVIGEDIRKFKSGVAFLLTTRGTPMMYYGTEILMKNFTDPDGKVREDFPGGWKEDKVDKFTGGGRDSLENAAFEYIKTLANYRKNTPALQTGKMTQFVPVDGVYTYFRYDRDKTIMVVMNTADQPKSVDLTPYAEHLSGFTGMKDVLTGKQISNLKTVDLQAFTTGVFELK